MKGLLTGILVLALSIAVPATFSGPGFLVIVWIAAGLIGLALIVTAEPVYSRLPQRIRPPDFKVTIEEDRWRVFDHEALILDAKVRVKNRTRHEKQISGVIFTSAGPSPHFPRSDQLQRELHNADARYKMLPGQVDAHDSVYGWHRWAVSRIVTGGAPAYTVTVRDELENDYSVSRKPRPSRQLY